MNFDVFKRTLKLNYTMFDIFNVDGKVYNNFNEFYNEIKTPWLLNVKAILKNDNKIEIHFTTKKLYDFKVVRDDNEKLIIDFMYENRRCFIEISNVTDEDGNYNEFDYEERIYAEDYILYFKVRNVFKDCDEYIEFNHEYRIGDDIDYIDDETISNIIKEIEEYIKTIKQ